MMFEATVDETVNEVFIWYVRIEAALSNIRLVSFLNISPTLAD